MRSLVIAIPLTLATLAGACGKTSEPGQSAGGQPSEAQAMFTARCAACHGADGTGNGPTSDTLNPKPRNYTDPAWQASITDDEIKRIILKGGPKLGKSAAMPGNPLLKDRPEVLDGLVKIIRGFGKRPQDGSAPARPITPRP